MSSYILIGPRGGSALTGNAHAGAFFAAASVGLLKIVETELTAVTIFPLHIFLHVRKTERGGETEKGRQRRERRKRRRRRTQHSL